MDFFLIFSKTVQAIETTFYSHSTSYNRTMCAIRSKPYGWDLKKKATISSENTKKIGHQACNQTRKPYEWDLRKKAKMSSKNTKKGHFWTFYNCSKSVQAIETIF